MPIQNSNRNTTWMLDHSDQTWTLTKNARINVENMYGIYEAGYSGNNIKILGDVIVKGNTYAGVLFNGSNSTVSLGKDGSIDARQATYGIHSEGAGSDIINRGLIRSGGEGIHGNIWNDVQNYGKIHADVGMTFMGEGSQIYNYGLIDADSTGINSEANGTHIENAKGATIDSDNIAIILSGSGSTELINNGTIRGDNTAIESFDNSELTLINTGKIFGEVEMGAGHDVFDSREGEMKGIVFGGDGDDDYFVGQTSMRISENSNMGSGYDRVHSTVNYRLDANTEELTLLGKKNIDGTGSNGDNNLYGNKGDNELSGRDGMDFIRGNHGNDILTGGEGQDRFLFAFHGDGVDRITDFEDGVDLVAIDSIDSQAEFDALNIKQVHGDVVINLGGGDKITIEHLLKSDFDYNDIYV